MLVAFGRYNAALLTLGTQVAADLGLTLSEMMALDHLYISGPSTPGALAQRTRLSSGAVTALLDRLEGRGFVRRVPHPQDRRSVMVEYIPQPREISGRQQQILQGLQALLAASDASSRQAIHAFLLGMIEAMERTLSDHP